LENHPDVFDPFGIGNIPGIEYDKPPFIWIEHYEDGARGSEATHDRATFDLIKFSHYEPRRAAPGRLAQGDRGAELVGLRPRQRGGADRGGALTAASSYNRGQGRG
jgi:hypothetical protein